MQHHKIIECTVEGPRDSVSTQETSTIYVCHKQEETTSTADCIHVGKLKTAMDMTVAQHTQNGKICSHCAHQTKVTMQF